MNDYLDQIERQLSELTEQGAHRRLRARRPGFGGARSPGGSPRPPRRGSEALAILAAVAVAAAVVAVVVLNIGTGSPRRSSASAPTASSASGTTATGNTQSQPAPTVSTTTSSSTPSAYLQGPFHPQSFTAISELTWWLLGSGACPAGESGPCATILRTTDGGPTFKAISAPAAPLAGSDTSSAGYSQIRFADANDGYAYGPDLYATHDGGASWQQVSLGGRISDLEISAGEAYAVVTNGAGNSGRLERSPVGQDQWAALPAAGEVSGGLWVLGREVLVQSGSDGPGTKLLVSLDGGSTFIAHPAPSPGLPCDFQTALPPIIWAHCATGTESGVWRSTDDGASFTPVPPRSELSLRLPNSAVLAAASGTTAVVGYNQLYRTADAGATWTPVGAPGIAQWTYLGFSDPTHGVALGYVGQVAPANARLYYTTDAGQSYHLVPLP